MGIVLKHVGCLPCNPNKLQHCHIWLQTRSKQVHWKTNSNCSHSISFRLSIWMKGAKEVSPIWARIMRKSRGVFALDLPQSQSFGIDNYRHAVPFEIFAGKLRRFKGFRGSGFWGLRVKVAMQSKHTCVSEKFTAFESDGGGAEAMSHCLPNAKGYTRWRSDRKRDRHAADMGNYSPLPQLQAGNGAIHRLGIAFLYSPSV